MSAANEATVENTSDLHGATVTTDDNDLFQPHTAKHTLPALGTTPQQKLEALLSAASAVTGGFMGMNLSNYKGLDDTHPLLERVGHFVGTALGLPKLGAAYSTVKSAVTNYATIAKSLLDAKQKGLSGVGDTMQAIAKALPQSDKSDLIGHAGAVLSEYTTPRSIPGQILARIISKKIGTTPEYAQDALSPDESTQKLGLAHIATDLAGLDTSTATAVHNILNQQKEQGLASQKVAELDIQDDEARASLQALAQQHPNLSGGDLEQIHTAMLNRQPNETFADYPDIDQYMTQGKLPDSYSDTLSKIQNFARVKDTQPYKLANSIANMDDLQSEIGKNLPEPYQSIWSQLHAVNIAGQSSNADSQYPDEFNKLLATVAQHPDVAPHAPVIANIADAVHNTSSNPSDLIPATANIIASTVAPDYPIAAAAIKGGLSLADSMSSLSPREALQSFVRGTSSAMTSGVTNFASGVIQSATIPTADEALSSASNGTIPSLAASTPAPPSPPSANPPIPDVDGPGDDDL